MAKRGEYLVDTYGMPRGEEIAICQFVLRLIASVADTFETDIPMSNLQGQPDEVIAAARHLSNYSKSRGGENEDYRATGVISAKNRDDWGALVTFAAHAYDATTGV
jgi:hypothetical protein